MLDGAQREEHQEARRTLRELALEANQTAEHHRAGDIRDDDQLRHQPAVAIEGVAR